jgi:DNA-binding NtrC family response regulator
MKQGEQSENSVYLSAVAHVYDNLVDLPTWFRRLTPGQLHDIARMMADWQAPPNPQSTTSIRIHFTEIPRLDDVERDVVLHAIRLCGGVVTKAAVALDIGKTTIYRKLRVWGCDPKAMSQSSVLARVPLRPARATSAGQSVGMDSASARARGAGAD